MHIQSISMWTGKSDNYAYLVVDDKSKDAIIIDPANPDEVAPILNRLLDQKKINLTAIINTHHHWDHSGGNDRIIIGGKDCKLVTETPKDGESFKLGDINVKALYTPCHTQDSICWLMEDSTGRAIFTGDTLFHGGCGRFFEGTSEEMHIALNKTLAAVPDDTKVYPGHEYTKANVKFAMSVLQSEPVKKLHEFAENNKETQGKFTIGDEKQHNVFMRMDDPEIQKATGKTDPIEVMAQLREMKNSFNKPPKRRAPATAEASTPKVRQSKLAKENNITAAEENEIREAFALFAEKRKGVKEGVIPIGDVRRAMIALSITPAPSELHEFLTILDPEDEGFAEFESFLAICALKLHARSRTSDSYIQEVDEAFQLFTSGGGEGKITIATLRKIANDLKEEVGDDLLRDMILEANGGAGVGKGVEKGQFEEVMLRAGVWR
ncbi:beta-lactamase-like protein [Amylocarpus encephaloides]|uniref:hydroxyacylglutathione hydrolase n=1 Tax=Amylocarpus encephaloides TaxID=45428 RepID=A0A9P8C899_9HELO|nr:beta-lactamase-like protein [Amylocarpus encephaloides]